MARYIDADALIEVLQGWREDSAMYDDSGNPVDSILYDVIRHIEDVPTANVAPRAELAREIFDEMDEIFLPLLHEVSQVYIYVKLRRKYTEAEPPKGE